MSRGGFRIENLHVAVEGREVIGGLDLEVGTGEVHVVMGPNGSGKSSLAHALMGRPGFEITEGTVTVDGQSLVGLRPDERARLGLFLALQQPIEVPGVGLRRILGEVVGDEIEGSLPAEAMSLGVPISHLDRGANADLSGGEMKRSEILQLLAVRPKFAILDEIDSGLDVDALGTVARRLERATEEWGLGVLAITHFERLMRELRVDRIHVLVEGRFVAEGGPELAVELESEGYAGYAPTKG